MDLNAIRNVINVIELLVLVVVALIGVGRLLQRSDDSASRNTQDIAKLIKQYDQNTCGVAAREFLDRELKNIEARFEQANKEMSRLASFVQGLDVRWRQEFVTRDVCDARMDSVQRELNGGKE